MSDMKIYQYCPNCRSSYIEDIEDGDPGEVSCNRCDWQGFDTWLVREDGTNDDEDE